MVVMPLLACYLALAHLAILFPLRVFLGVLKKLYADAVAFPL